MCKNRVFLLKKRSIVKQRNIQRELGKQGKMTISLFHTSVLSLPDQTPRIPPNVLPHKVLGYPVILFTSDNIIVQIMLRIRRISDSVL